MVSPPRKLLIDRMTQTDKERDQNIMPIATPKPPVPPQIQNSKLSSFRTSFDQPPKPMVSVTPPLEAEPISDFDRALKRQTTHSQSSRSLRKTNIADSVNAVLYNVELPPSNSLR